MRDITTREVVNDTGVVGRCYQFDRDMLLWEYERLPWTSVVPADELEAADRRMLDTIQRGTRVRVTKVVELNYIFANSPTDLHFTFGRILDAPRAGEVVEIGEAGVAALSKYGDDGPYIDEAMVSPCDGATSESGSHATR